MHTFRSEIKPQSKQPKKKEGITLLEILTVVIILGILTLMVKPKFSPAQQQEDPEAILKSQLQTIRCQLEMYKVQHEGQYPFGIPEAPVEPQELVKRLTSTTTVTHKPGGIYGPYLYEFPANPINDSATLRYGTDPGADKAGWCLDPATGMIFADNNAAEVKKQQPQPSI